MTAEIHKQMEKDGTDYVWEDLREIPAEELENMTTVGKVIDYLKSVNIEV